RHDSRRRIDRECEDFLGRLVGYFLDVHAPFGGNDERDTRSLAIDQRREVKFAIDRRPLFDIEPVDFLAVRAGLMRDQGRSENACRFFFYVIDRLDDLDTACLTASTGVNLRLHHPYGPAQLFGPLDGFLDAESRNTSRHRKAEFAQYSFGL